MNNPFEIRKVVGGVILTILWVCTFLFIKPTLVIDWLGDGTTTTSFKMVVVLIGLLVIFSGSPAGSVGRFTWLDDRVGVGSSRRG